MNPKVFVSHASEDKERFVLEFAEKLRGKGIDAWLDKWEMYPGDSLIDKIFEEGIKEAQAFIIVLSNNSVDKPWVREELNTGIVKRIENGCKLIPVVIDDCEIPESLRSTVWQKIDNVKDYEKEFNRIVIAVFGADSKPPLGSVPSFTSNNFHNIGVLNKIDSLVFKSACELGIVQNDIMINSSQLFEKMKTHDISEDVFFESIEMLNHESYVKATMTLSRTIPMFSITSYGFNRYLEIYEPNYPDFENKTAFSIVNEEKRTNHVLSSDLGIPLVIMNHILSGFESRGFISTVTTLGGNMSITNISVAFKRQLTT